MMKRKIIVSVVILGLMVAGGLFLTLDNNLVQAASSTSIVEIATFGSGRSHIDSEDLADALSMSIDELEDAKAVAVANTIDQALELDLITQEETDELQSEERSSRRGLYKLLDSDDWDQLDYDTFLLDALGITEDAYKAALDTIEQTQSAEAVADGTITQEEADAIAGQRALMSSAEFTESIKAAYEAAITEALEDGNITQEQADALLTKLEDASFSIFHEKLGHSDSHRPGCRPSKMEDTLTPEESETLYDDDV